MKKNINEIQMLHRLIVVATAYQLNLKRLIELEDEMSEISKELKKRNKIRFSKSKAPSNPN